MERAALQRREALGHQVLEATQVELLGRDGEAIAGRLRHQHLRLPRAAGRLDDAAQVRHVRLQRRAGITRWVVAPHQVDQAIELRDRDLKAVNTKTAPTRVKPSPLSGVEVKRGSIKATVLIETILAAFEMDEILYELREHSAGLNCGRWDYIFSFIKVLRNHEQFVLPDRSTVTMDKHFLKSYVDLLIQTCHKRGIHAMGGMAAQIPIKNDAAANDQALERVRQDKLREVRAGHDGTWVAHPGLVPIAREIFDTMSAVAYCDCPCTRRCGHFKVMGCVTNHHRA